MATSGAKPVYCELIRGEPLKLEDAHCNYPEYTSVVALSGDMLIVVDTEAFQVRLHSCQNGHLLATSARLQAQPHDICLVESRGTQVAVTLANGQMEILSVESIGRSAVIRRVWTSDAVVGKFKYCQGVRALKHGNQLVVSGGTEDKEMQGDWICWGIVSLDKSDKFEVTVFNICESGGAGYGSSSYLATSTNDSTVFISCWTGPHYPENNGVYAFDVKEGRRKFIYRHHELNKPKGICVDKQGFIYVCNMRPPCIHQLTESREPLIIHKMPPLPLAIYWEEKREELYVTSMRSKEIWRLHPQWNEEVISTKESSSTTEKHHLVLGEQNVASDEEIVHLWARENGINAGAVDELLKEGFTSIKALKLLEPNDLVNTKILRGQQKLILASVKQLIEKDSVQVQYIQSECTDISFVQRSTNDRQSTATQQTVPLMNLIASTSWQTQSVGKEDPNARTISDIPLNDQLFNPHSASVDTQIYHHPAASADRHSCYTGLVVLSQDNIIAIDFSASQIHLLSLQDGCILAVYKPDSKPWDICVYHIGDNDNETQMAVCLLSCQIEILSIKFTNKTTEITRIKSLNIQTGFDVCFGLKCLNKKFVVSGYKQGSLCWGIVSITDGNIQTVHKICKCWEHGWSFLCTDNKNMVFISCYAGDENPDVTGVYGYRNSRRKFLYQHKDLGSPAGVTVDTRGHVFVCNKYPSCIHQITGSGQPLTIHTKGIQPSSQLCAIHWNQQDGLVYFTSWYSNVITRFRLEYSDDQDPLIPVEVLKMDEKSLHMYKEALRGGKEKVYNIRVMIVGQHGVGKTTLTKRLLGKDVNISERKSTEGIDVHIECSNVSLLSGEWTAQEKSSEQDYRLLRLAKVLNEKQSVRDRAADEETSQREKNSDSATSVREEEHVTIPQGNVIHNSDRANVAVEDNVVEGKVTEVLYHRSPPRGIGQNLSSMVTHPEDSHSLVEQRKQAQSDTFTVARSQSVENIPSGSHKIDPMKELIQLLQENINKLKQDTEKNSPVSVWDFAGQYSFYTTHQIFLTRRAIYLLVSDISGHITDLVDDDCYFDSEGILKSRVCELIEVWLNFIHSCAPSPEAGNPPVILVGTHMDKISQVQPKPNRKCKLIIQALCKLLSSKQVFGTFRKIALNKL